MSPDQLHRQLLKAHADGDTAAIIRLYTLAADHAEQKADVNAACFFLTHAFVFALEAGAPEADRLNLRLFKYGRETRQKL